MFRGLFNPSTNFVTVNPCGAIGVLPSGQPITLLNFVLLSLANGAGRFTCCPCVVSTVDSLPAFCSFFDGSFLQLTANRVKITEEVISLLNIVIEFVSFIQNTYLNNYV